MLCSVAQSCLTLCNPMDCSPQGSSVLEIFQPEYWSGLPFPHPEDLPDPGIKPSLLGLPHCRADSLPLSHLGSSLYILAPLKSGIVHNITLICGLISRAKTKLTLNYKSFVGIAMYLRIAFFSWVKNYHKLSSLKQYKFIILPCGSEVWHKSHWAKLKLLGGEYSFLEALYKGLFPCSYRYW